MPYQPPSRMQAASPSLIRVRGGRLIWAVLLLVAGVGFLAPGLGAAYSHHQIERTRAADQLVTVEVYREGRAVYRDAQGEITFARAPDGYPAGGMFDLLADPARPTRLQSPDESAPASWIAPTCIAAGGALLVAGLVILRWAFRRPEPRAFGPPQPAPRWQANVALIVTGSATPAQEASPGQAPPHAPQVRPWLPPEPGDEPPAGSTGVLRYAWLSPACLALVAGIFTFALPQLGGPGRGVVVAVGAVALWLPTVTLALAAATYRVTVSADGRLVIRTLVNRRRYDLSQLAQVTGWTWSIDRADVHDGLPRLGCWNLGLHFRDGRHLFWSPTNVRDHILVGRAIRYWALRSRAAVTPDMAYGLGLVPDPQAVDRSPLPIAHDAPVLRRAGRRIRTALIYVAHVALVFITIGALPAVIAVANSIVGPAPDPRVFDQPCDLLEDLELAGREPLGPADDTVAWHGCGSGESRDLWLAVNPSVHAAPRTVRYWLDTNDDIAAAPIVDPALLAELDVEFAHLVTFRGGERVTIAYVASEVSGLASVTSGVTDTSGRPLSDAARFDAVVALVRAVTTSAQGNQPVRSFNGDGAGGATRTQVIEAAQHVDAEVDELDAWLEAIGRAR